MATPRCDFVPKARASWLCPHCNTHYSDTCIPDGFNPLWGRDGPRCILCHADLISTSDAALAPPFWHKLPYFFAYPLHINALLIIALGAGGTWILGGGWPSLVWLVIWSLMTVKYFFAVLAERAAGRRWPPSLLEIVKSDTHYLLLQFILLHAVFGAALAGALYFDHRLALGLLVLIVFAYPAMIMLLAVTKSLLGAINPGLWWQVIGAMGLAYILLWIFLLLLGGLSSLLNYLVLPRLPGEWQLIANVATGAYFSFITYGLMGYALFQYRDEIGLDQGDESIEDGHMDETRFRRTQALGAVLVLRQRGELERARQTLRELLDICRDDPELHRQYQDLLLEMGDAKALPRHTDYYARLLLDSKRPRQAAEVMLTTLRRLPDYRPESLSLVVGVAPALQRAKQYRALAQLLGNAHKSHASDPQLPEAYLLLADTLAGPLQQPQKARQLVMYMLKRYPDMTLRRDYEKRLNKLK